MRRYLRCRDGSLYFFTVVTHERRPILTTELGRRGLRLALLTVGRRHPFRIIAICLLPDHLHVVMELPRDDTDYSTRWRLIKSEFTRLWCAEANEGSVNASRIRQGERGVWQRRFYEHTCRDEEDLWRCIEYVHVNPLKHGLVQRVIDWPWSSFHRYVREARYPANWGSAANWYGDEFAGCE
jgi:putative transposase